jgi:uncharacterized metal-binding protein
LELTEIISESWKWYSNPENRLFARNATLQEAAGYDRTCDPLRPVKCRIEEVCDFAKRMDYKVLGLAFCSGLIQEALQFNEILISKGFDVVSAVCKAGATPKEKLGITEEQKLKPGTFEAMCNPVAQAMLLNEAGVEFTIMMGLCVGHDAIFLKNIESYATVLAVKDRLLCHNPLAALYTSGSYYKSIK